MKRGLSVMVLAAAMLAAGLHTPQVSAEEISSGENILAGTISEAETSAADELAMEVLKGEAEILSEEEFYMDAIPSDDEAVVTAKAESTEKEITLYVIEDSYQEYLTLPDGYLASYDVSGHTCTVESGDSVTIENEALVPSYEIWYYYQDADSGYWVGRSNPSGVEGEITKKNYNYEDSVIELDGESVTVHVVNYAQYYSIQIMQDYMEENITADMTEYEKAEQCCKFVAQYDYGTKSSGYTGMIVTGSGDCWASTSTLLYMLDYLGIKAKSRDASSDAGAGSRHINVLAALDGYYYILEAGYTGSAPRQYSMTKYSSSNLDYIYKVTSESDKTISITDYEPLTPTADLTVPEEIDGYQVTAIGNKAFYNAETLESVTLPETLLTIGNQAFAMCYSLKKISIPDSVTSIGSFPFILCGKLTSLRLPASLQKFGIGIVANASGLEEITVSSDNPYLCSVDGVLFDAEKTKLYAYPNGRKNICYEIPEGVTSIASYAFTGLSYNGVGGEVKELRGKTEIVLPQTMENIEENAFYQAYAYKVTVQPGITSISAYAFNRASIARVILPDTVETIEEYAFYYADMEYICLPSGLKTIGAYAFAGNLKMDATLPASVDSIGSYAFYLNYGWSSLGTNSDEEETDYEVDVEEDAEFLSHFGYIHCEDGCDPSSIEENAFYGQVYLGVAADSPMYEYAVKNKVYYMLVEAEKKSLKDAEITLSETSYVYDGEAKTPTVTVTYHDELLVENQDYTVEYGDNVNEGSVSVTIRGTGEYVSCQKKYFNITKKSLLDEDILVEVPDMDYTGEAVKPVPVITFNGKKLYYNRDYYVSYEDNVEIGTGKVTVTGTGNYKGTLELSFEIGYGISGTGTQDTDTQTTDGQTTDTQSTTSKTGSWRFSVKIGTKQKVTSIKITVKGKKGKAARKFTVKAGKKLKLQAVTTPAGASLEWESSNKKYATVNQKGVVKAKKAGKGRKVRIFAYAQDGSGKVETITVKIKK